MAFAVTLYPFHKKQNSTQVPTAGVGTLATTCELKWSCSIIQPVISFDARTFTENDVIIQPTKYTYAHIPNFARYYWITNWSWQNGLWYATLEVDVLASYKTDIGTSTQYVLRAASAYNTDIPDNKYPTYYRSNQTNSAETVVTTPWKVSLSSADMVNGFFMVGIVNNDTAAIGATSYYYFSPKSMRYFLGKLMAAPSWMNITDASLTADMQKLMFNPMQYIVSCMYIPMELPAAFRTSALMVTDLPIGWWSIDMTGADAMSIFRATFARPASAFSFDITIPRHPDASNRNYLKLSPYSEYSLEFAPFGLIPLDSTKIYGNDTLHVSVKVDFITGRGSLWLNCGSGARFYMATSQVGIPISIAQVTLDRSTIMSGGTWLMSAGLALVQNHGAEIEATVNRLATGISSERKKEIGASALASTLVGATPMLYSFTAKEGGASAAFGEDTTVSNELISMIQKDFGDILNAAIASSGICAHSGQTGGFDSYTDSVRLLLHYCSVVSENVARYGKPLCSSVVINTLSGYVLCGTADIETVALKAERELITAYMTGGFYYE